MNGPTSTTTRHSLELEWRQGGMETPFCTIHRRTRALYSILLRSYMLLSSISSMFSTEGLLNN